MIIVPSPTVIASELFTDVSLITPPTIEPIDLDEAKKHLRFTPTSEDTLIDTYIAMARQLFEEITGRQLLDATWEYRIEGFPAGGGAIELPKPPLLELVSVVYVGEDGADVALVEDTDFVVERPTGPYAKRGTVRAVEAWPTVDAALEAIKIRYRAGYGTQPGDVPELIRGALGFLVAHFHANRVEVADQTSGNLQIVPWGADAIMRPFKYSALPQRPALRRVPV